jgi:hypothetical protein
VALEQRHQVGRQQRVQVRHLHEARRPAEHLLDPRRPLLLPAVPERHAQHRAGTLQRVSLGR